MDFSRNHRFMTLIGCSFLCAANVTNASELATTASNAHQLTIFKQQLGLYFPSHWRLAHSEQIGTMFSAEFVPQQEFLTSWSSLYCIQAFKGLANAIEPELFLDTFASNYQQICEGEVKYQKLGASSIEGKQSYSAMLTCSKMPHTHRGESKQDVAMGEIGHYTVIAGADDLFLLHRSARGDDLLSATHFSVTPPLKMVADITTLR
ncbi:hypothetical protein [Shewanella psychrotolerans]|uniref:hypothetical protein n=1 Tax=Shewanella psychrotolerans TaxID=2864206 RepID=UPI001C661BB8|nr:hypothetical protein [Shewanella psychrotolerans]QYK02260.1 hypothetical protein K0I62_04600 [Shewanella psychrotolerans]